MKSELKLLQRVLNDVENRCCISTHRDWLTFSVRVEREGLSFLTLTMPKFGKDFESCLAEGFVPNRGTDSQKFLGFKFNGALPALMRGLLAQVFDAESGVLLDHPSPDAIQAVRQVCGLYSKIEIECAPKRKRKAFVEFVKCENQLTDQPVWGTEKLLQFKRIASLLFGHVFQVAQSGVRENTLLPKHGPGATAEKILGNQKFVFKEWPTRLDEVFSVADYTIPNYRHWESLQGINMVEPGDERPVRVVAVPKTMKTPRIIAIEPVAMQYMQQSLKDVLVEECERATSVCRGLIGFEDQVPNQVLAKEGSSEGSLATLDLSEASDRVTIAHVRHLMADFPDLLRAVEAVRSTHADVPFEGVIPLKKYASMGSALTFPLEAMVFLTVIFCGIEEELSTPFRHSNQFRRWWGLVRVYGDDIVVPVEHVRSVIANLESFGFVVNKSKSFWTGKFRESCGKEYYDGHDVSIVKVRHDLPSSRTDGALVSSAVSLRNHFYWSGYWETARYLDRALAKLLLGYYPIVGVNSPVLGRESVFEPMAEAVHRDLQTPIVKGFVEFSDIPSNEIDGIAALQKVLASKRLTPFDDEKHLERSGRPRAVNIKLGYGSAV